MRGVKTHSFWSISTAPVPASAEGVGADLVELPLRGGGFSIHATTLRTPFLAETTRSSAILASPQTYWSMVTGIFLGAGGPP
jgi:hypothetical protein